MSAPIKNRRLLKLKDSLPKVGNPSRSTFYEGIATGRFPKPVRIGPGAVRWLEDELEDSVRAMIAARDTGK
jgi:prophage regulatory protein